LYVVMKRILDPNGVKVRSKKKNRNKSKVTSET